MIKTKRFTREKHFPTYFILIALLGVFIIAPGQVHAGTINVAVIETENLLEADTSLYRMFKDELIALFKGEHQINFKSYAIKKDASIESHHRVLEQAYADPKTEMVLVLDMAANQILGRRPFFAKPTFLPLVFSGQLLGYPIKGSASGRKNLNYQTEEVNFEEKFKTLARVAPFRHAVLITDASITRTINPAMIEESRAHARNAGVDLIIRTYDGDTQKLLSSLPKTIDAVMYGALPTAGRRQLQNLINGVNGRQLVSFSLIGEAPVRMGALATNRPDTDWQKRARQTAIHMQDVFLGTPASRLPVLFITTGRLMVNMETSRIIGYSPRFDVLSEATLINEDKISAHVNYSLIGVARKAVEANLSLAAQRLAAEITREAVNEVRGALLPQLKSSITHSRRKDTNHTRVGTFAENSTDASLTFTHSLFSEKRWAAYTIQKYSHLSEKEVVKETELDIIQSAVNAYLNVLRGKTTLDQARYNLQITRQNHQLAKNRVTVGSRNASDLYRWESEVANAKRNVLSAKSSLEQQRQTLNRILDRPIGEVFTTTVETLENPFLLISDKGAADIISNPASLEKLTDFFVETGLEQAPELKQLRAQMAGLERQLKSHQRAFWLPDLNLTAEYTNTVDEDREVGIAAEENDWQVGVELSLPLYEGGAKSARRAQGLLAVRQLQMDYRNTINSIEQDIRSTAEAVHASYASIDLTRVSEQAARKNYDLVAESYAQGRDSIVDVLDAQEALIEAREAAMNAVYGFLIDLMNLQRANGVFDFFLTDGERRAFQQKIMTHQGRYNTIKHKDN